MRALAAFDPLWEAKVRRDGCSKGEARGRGYAWLAKQLEIDRAGCHIGMFDEALCERVIEICRLARAGQHSSAAAPATEAA